MSGIHRFLTRREKKNAKEEIKILEQRVAQLGITGLRTEHISYALQSDHAKGDVDKAFEMLMILEDAIEGIIRGYTPTTKLLGAVNREGVTCYLDALLFAMFARLDCFEAILYKSFNDEPRRKLSILLRLWVNMLRSGRLITTDLTKHLQDALAECGWEDAAKLRQQDTSEAFTFITEKLELPLLTLKMDIYHTGKEDVTGDHKFVNERLLEVAIPEPADGETVTLEDCLESYFNNRIEVKRHLERRHTVGSTKSMDSIAKGCTTHVETIEVGSPLSPSSSQSHSPLDDVTPVASLTEVVESDPPPYRRSSIVQERFIPGDEKAQDGTITSQRRGSYRKEVMMPAWQFFSLIPWYTDNTPTNDAQVAAHFSSKRPILGMCLKRYSMTPTGKAIRLNTYIDIPTEIGLPHFIQDDSMEEEGPIYGNFKLSLQAMVCHRGTSVDSGHYISIVRGTSAGAPPASSHGPDQEAPPDASRYWMRFDDLAKERVTLVDIEQALKHESPYLLFYQILPINEDAAAANLFDKPPSSELSTDSRDIENAFMAQKPQNLSVDDIVGARAEGCASGRPSFEITGPDGAEPAPMDHNSRKQSVAFSEVFDPTSMQSYAPTSPRLTPRDDDGKASFSFSRRSSRHTRSNPGSRAGSQASESRIGTTFSRFTGRLSREKFTNDGVSEGDVDELTENELGPTEKFSSPSYERKDRSPRRTRDSERVRDKLKDKSREKIGRKLDRECVVM
ncbi:hypothetical protein AbraIFM66951_007662 [Aspergillus brasiliensis]|uniref:ubiquitinyl hydrolase 1 n=1 Tax=Aspergillus brasiliensis TaxID=319629 RepID=A0A9W5YMG5_9EURO|nr:hypothetical protein AbraCBS73388_001866 [Aspergillus brasiliensis]GKZ41107.1 hypothetical protein AbraIFM66951_007662 [Aspergillus brasiliensis]